MLFILWMLSILVLVPQIGWRWGPILLKVLCFVMSYNFLRVQGFAEDCLNLEGYLSKIWLQR
jgi:hypothetical protein